MSFDGFDDDFYWNEYQWEAHLDELEKKSEQLRKFITSDPKGNIPRWILLLRENIDEDEAVDAFIEEELLLDEAYFPEDEDDWEEEEDDLDDDELFLENEDLFFPEEEEDEDDIEKGEEWKFLSDEFTHSDYGSLENLHTYNTAKILAVDILKWAEAIPEQYRNPAYHDFIGEILKIGAKLAGGYSFGYERDYLGGNIAYNKKGLYCANNALQLLQKQKKAPYMSPVTYRKLHNRLFDLRNDIGIYIQELRDRFNFGLE
ncbi:MAG: hypothetical protein WEC12_08715 [Balneolaceae bacterium]